MATITITDEHIRIAEIAGTTPEVIAQVFTPEAILERAADIYDFMRENNVDEDSWTREELFAHAARNLNVDYDVLYYKWMRG